MITLKDYCAMKEALAFASTEEGKQILASIPDSTNNLLYGYQTLNGMVFDEAIKSTPTNLISSQILEYNAFKNVIPTTSFATIKSVNEKLDALKQEFQNFATYEPVNFFNLYFILNGETQKTANNEPIMGSMSKNVAFDSWFEGSKVVDENNEPLIVFHGTGATDFVRFSFDVFPGTYFGENRTYSEWFANLHGGEDGNIFECYLRVVNPIDLRLFKTEKVLYSDFVGYIELKYGYKLQENLMLKTGSERNGGLWAWQYLRGGTGWLKQVIQDGVFDGFTFYENNPSDTSATGEENQTPAWLVFKSEQIKAAHGNVTFSFNSKDIRFKKGGEL